MSERPKKVVEAARAFVKASEGLLSRDAFFDGIGFYTGSLSPTVRDNVDVWRRSGAIPPSEMASMYPPGTIADLSSIGAIKARKTRLATKFRDVYEKNKEVISRDDLYERVAEYQDSLMCLASSSKVLQDTISKISDDNNSWVSAALVNLEWMKKTVTMSIARVYQAFGKLVDKVTGKIDEIVSLLSRWASELKKQLVDKVRELSQHFLELFNSLISALFSWISKLREIAQEKGFRLSKVTITLDPLEFVSLFVFGLPIPIPNVKLPKIEMEFT